MRVAIIAFSLGVLCLQMQASVPSPPLFLLGGLLCLPGLRWRGWPARVALALACFLFGLAWAGWRAEWRLADELDKELVGHDVQVVGLVSGLPQAFEHGLRFEFTVEQSLRAAPGVPSRLLLAWYAGRAGVPAVTPGQRWQFTVRLKRPHGSSNPGGFDYEAWLLERGIRATGYVRPGPATLLDDFVWRPASIIHGLRAWVRDNFRLRLPPDEYPWQGILTALAVGDQQAVDSDLWIVFNRTGVTHLMSISGLHVTLVAGLVGALFSLLWRRAPALALRCPAQRVAVMAGVLTAVIYALLAGFGVPAQRTLYMLAVAAAAMLSGRILAPSRVLALALLLVLLIDPWSVLAAGFWLSFGAVAALFLVGSALVGGDTGWRQRLRGWGLVQWAATLASLPVLMLVFQQFPLISPLANAVAVPLISFVVTPLALLAAVLPWTPLLQLTHAIVSGLMEFLFWCAAWPVWQAPAPPAWAVFGGALGVALCLLPRGVPGKWLGLVLLLPALYWPPRTPPPGSAWIDVLDVGQGQAVLIRTHAHAMVYDPGPRYSADADAGQRVLVPYLRWLGVSRLDRVMVTHGDGDHAGGLASLRAAVPISHLSSSLAEIEGELCAAGQHWQWDNVDFSVLHPAADAYRTGGSGNSLSCVLAVDAHGQRMLLTADIEAADENALIARDGNALRSSILLVPHHGAKGASTDEFVRAVGAREVIYSVGYRNRFGHPRPEVEARYASSSARQWRTDRDGAIHIVLAPTGIAVNAERAQMARYWHGR